MKSLNPILEKFYTKLHRVLSKGPLASATPIGISELNPIVDGDHWLNPAATVFSYVIDPFIFTWTPMSKKIPKFAEVRLSNINISSVDKDKLHLKFENLVF